MSGLHLAQPWWLLALLALPLYLAWYLWRYAPHRLRLRLSYDPGQLRTSTRSFAFVRWLPQVLLLVAAACIIVALARPQTTRESVVAESKGIDIVLALDASASMETPDFAPNRITVAKQLAKNFVAQRRDDRIALVVFARDALSFAPLTLDYTLLQQQLDAISTRIMDKQGTALGNAIGVGIQRLEGSAGRSKVIILLTDGVNTAGSLEPVAAARLAAAAGIRLYCIGVGKPEFVHTDSSGRSELRKTDLDEASMRQAAQLTGGRYYSATDERALAAIFDEIHLLEGAAVHERVQRETLDHHHSLLLAAGLALLLALGLVHLGVHNLLEE